MDTYFLLCHNTINQYIAAHPILELFVVVERRPGELVKRWWWEQGVLDLELDGGRAVERVTEVGMEANA